MEAWSITCEKLRKLWAGYWSCTDSAQRQEIQKAIRAITSTIVAQNATIKTLTERCEESDRLLIAARGSSRKTK